MTPFGQKWGITIATAMKSEYQPIVLTLAEGGKPAVGLEVGLIVSTASLTPIITFFRFYHMA